MPTLRSSRILSKSISSVLAFAAISGLTQAAVKVWDGGVGGTGIDLAAAANWSGDTLPLTTDTMQWNGAVAGNLSLSSNESPNLATGGGLVIDVTSAQTGSLLIDNITTNTSATNPNSIRLLGVTIASGAGAFTLGNGVGTSVFTLGSGATNNTNVWTNNSANAATISSDVIFANGGGITIANGGRVVQFAGSGNWNVNAVFGVTIVGGSGAFALTKSGTGTLTLSAANTYAGVTTLSGGRIVLANTGALGASTQINFGAVSGTSVEYATDAPVTNVIPTIAGTGFNTTIVLNRATSGAALTQGLGAASYGGGTLNVQAGANVATGTPTLTYTSVGLTSGTANSTAAFNPTTANVTINSASITSTANAKNLGLAGTSTGNSIPGIISNGIAGATLSLVKSGSSTWTLGGASTYTGATTITGGTLAVTGTGSINGTSGITINGSGAKLLQTSTAPSTAAITLTQGTLDGSGTMGAVTVATNVANVVANGNGTPTTLTLSTLAFNGAATMNLNVAGTLGVAVTGGLTTTSASGQVTINGSGVGWANGLNNLISFGTFTGAISDFTKGTFTGFSGRQTSGALQLNGSNIALNVIGDNPLWTGANGGVWQQFAQSSPTSATPAWKLQSALTDTDFWVADTAVFDDSATGTTTATIHGGNINAGSLTFNNTVAKDYTITTDDGSGIAGGVLTKNNNGKLTILTANTYASGTALNNGTLILDNASAIGTGALTITGGALDSTVGTVLSTNNVQNWNGDFSAASTTALDLGSGAVTVGGAGTDRTVTVNTNALTVGEVRATGKGLIKQGDGTLILTSTGATGATDGSRVSGVLNVAAGTLQINRTGALDAATSGDLTAGGVTGTGTITNGANVERWLVSNFAGTADFSGTLANGGLGALGLNKVGTGTQTISGVNNFYTGQTTVDGGTLIITGANLGAGTNAVINNGNLVLGVPGALGATSLIRLTGNNVSTLTFASDGGDNLYNFTMGTGTVATIVSDRATPGEGLNRTLSTQPAVGVGGGTLNFTSGPNVTSGTSRITFNQFGLASGTGGAITVLNPTTANVTVGTITKSVNTPVQTIEFGGTSTENFVTGAITNGTTATLSVNKSNSSTWTLGGNNTYTGATTLTGGTLILTGTNTTTGLVSVGTGATLSVGSISAALGNVTRIDLGGGGTTGRLLYTGAGETTNRPVGGSYSSAGSTEVIDQSGTGALKFTADMVHTNTVAGTLVLQGSTSGTGEIAGKITNSTGAGTPAISLTKNGTGTWTLSGANTYTGATSVNNGTLITTPAQTGASTVTVADGATFGVKLASAGTAFSFNTLNTGTTTGAALLFDTGTLGNPTAAPMNVTTFTANAPTTLRVAGTALAVGSNIPLIDYGGLSIGGVGFAGLSLALPARTLGSLVNNTGSTRVDLNITSIEQVKWKGNVNGNWDADTDGTAVNGTQNWLTTGTLTPTKYLQGTGGTDTANFDDSATGTPVVNLTTTLTPNTTLVNNTTAGVATYTFTGDGKISGTGGLTKQGNGTLILANSAAYDYTGGTTISGGTLQFGDGVTSGLGLLPAGAITNNATLALNRPDDFSIAQAIGGTGTIVKANANTVTFFAAATNAHNFSVANGTLRFIAGGNLSGTISGAGQLASTGGTLQLSGTTANSNTGLTTVSAGVLQLNKTAGLSAIGGDVLITGSGTLAILANEQIPDTATITFTGTSTDATVGTTGTETVANVIASPSVAGGQFLMRNNFTVTGTATLNLGVLGTSSGHTSNLNALNITGGLLRIAGSTGASVLNIGAGGITASGGEIQVKFNTANNDATLNLGGNFTATNSVNFTNAGYTGPNLSVINLVGADRTFDIAAGATTIVAPAIAGSFGLIKAGDGTLTLNGAENYPTLTTLAGTTNLNKALGTGTSSITSNGTTNISVSQTLAALTIGDGGVVVLGGPAFAPAPEFAENVDAGLTAGAAQAVPEPGTASLLIAGALGLLGIRRRKS